MKLGIGVVGYGFMGRTHAASWLEAAALGIACELRAVCTNAPADVAVDGVSAYADFERMLNDEGIDIISICTPTDTHVELAIAALEAGKHVLLEKPVALSAAALQPLIDVAAQSRALCMPAHCMRFWPGWPYLRDVVAESRLGPVLAASFRRAGAAPAWNRTFYGDVTRSGGALFDLHIHDADFVLWCFGQPTDVYSAGTRNHVRTSYHYDGFSVDAEGAWADDPAAPFEMRYRVEFRHGVLDFSYDRTAPLELVRDTGRTTVEVPTLSAYTAQAMHLADAVTRGQRALRVTLADALTVTRLLERELENIVVDPSQGRP